MDPDGLDFIILAASFVLAMIFSWCAGSLCSNDTEREQRLNVGFTTRICGVSVCYVLSIGTFVYGLLQIFIKPAHLLFALLCLLAFCVLSALGFALGGLHGKDDEEGFALFRPVGAIIAAPSTLLFKALNKKVYEDVTEEDFLNLVDDVAEEEVINEHQKEMITNIVELDDVTAGEIMTHRKDVISVPDTAVVNDVVQIATKNGVSRLPVYHKTMDDIVGILYAKDLFTVWDDDKKSELTVAQFVRSPMYVPEARPARELLVDFRQKHTQIAIVVDEYGGTSGVVTMEDILEEIVGNIQDEFDNEAEDLQRQPDGSFIAMGSADFEETLEAFGITLSEDTLDELDFDTVGGFMFDKLGRIPTADEKACVKFSDVWFTVLKVSDRRIESVRCEFIDPKNIKQKND